MTPVQGWKCDHCNFSRQSKSIVRRHEKSCTKDMGKKGCVTCSHLSSEEEEKFYNDMNGRSCSEIFRVKYCNKKEIVICEYVTKCDSWDPPPHIIESTKDASNGERGMMLNNIPSVDPLEAPSPLCKIEHKRRSHE